MILYLFDIDGTLLHARRAGGRAFERVFRDQHGLERACEGVRFGGRTDPSLVDEVFVNRLGRRPTANEHAAFFAAYMPLMRAELMAGGVEVIDG
ncbi:MAG: hypothetical protein ABIY55_12700, partial [Kofleriaceae bacterium]